MRPQVLRITRDRGSWNIEGRDDLLAELETHDTAGSIFIFNGPLLHPGMLREFDYVILSLLPRHLWETGGVVRPANCQVLPVLTLPPRGITFFAGFERRVRVPPAINDTPSPASGRSPQLSVPHPPTEVHSSPIFKFPPPHLKFSPPSPRPLDANLSPPTSPADSMPPLSPADSMPPLSPADSMPSPMSPTTPDSMPPPFSPIAPYLSRSSPHMDNDLLSLADDVEEQMLQIREQIRMLNGGADSPLSVGSLSCDSLQGSPFPMPPIRAPPTIDADVLGELDHDGFMFGF